VIGKLGLALVIWTANVDWVPPSNGRWNERYKHRNEAKRGSYVPYYIYTRRTKRLMTTSLRLDHSRVLYRLLVPNMPAFRICSSKVFRG
jgi:hypothetical protein